MSELSWIGSGVEISSVVYEGTLSQGLVLEAGTLSEPIKPVQPAHNVTDRIDMTAASFFNLSGIFPEFLKSINILLLSENQNKTTYHGSV